jgi:hypothetical protein
VRVDAVRLGSLNRIEMKREGPTMILTRRF